MANEYAANQADLAAVADAIREKGGTTQALSFPDGFVNAVGAIQAGSEASDLVIALIQGTETIDTFEDHTITKIRGNVVANLNPRIVRCNAVTYIAKNGNGAFQSLSSLQEAYFPALTGMDNFTLRDCWNLKVLDAGKSYFDNYTLAGTGNLEILVLRGAPPWLNGTAQNFPSTCKMMKGEGTIYVPSENLEAYKTATNWSELYAANPDVFQPLEGSEWA